MFYLEYQSPLSLSAFTLYSLILRSAEFFELKINSCKYTWAMFSFKDTVRSLSMFFLISIFSTKYLFSYNNIIIIRKPIHWTLEWYK